MKKIKLLAPIIGLTALAATTIPIVSCNKGGNEDGDLNVLLFESEGVTLETTAFELNKDYSTKVVLADATLKVDSFVVLIDDVQLLPTKYMYDAQTSMFTIRAKFMTSTSVKIKVILAVKDPIIKLPTDEILEGETVPNESGGWVSKGIVNDCEFTNLVNEQDKFHLIATATAIDEKGKTINLDTNIKWTGGNKFNVEVQAQNLYFYGQDNLNNVTISFRFNTKLVDLTGQRNVFNFKFIPKIYIPEEHNVYPEVAANDGKYSGKVDNFMIVNPMQTATDLQITVDEDNTDTRILNNIDVSYVSHGTAWDPFWFGIEFSIVNDDGGEGYADAKLLPAGDYHVAVNIKYTYDTDKVVEKTEIFAVHIIPSMQAPKEIDPVYIEETAISVQKAASGTTTVNYDNIGGLGFAYNFYGYDEIKTATVKELTWFESTKYSSISYSLSQHTDPDKKHKFNLEFSIPQNIITEKSYVWFKFKIELTFVDESKPAQEIEFNNCAFIVTMP